MAPISISNSLSSQAPVTTYRRTNKRDTTLDPQEDRTESPRYTMPSRRTRRAGGKNIPRRTTRTLREHHIRDISESRTANAQRSSQSGFRCRRRRWQLPRLFLMLASGPGEVGEDFRETFLSYFSVDSSGRRDDVAASTNVVFDVSTAAVTMIATSLRRARVRDGDRHIMLPRSPPNRCARDTTTL